MKAYSRVIFPKALAIKRPDTHSYLWYCALYMNRSIYQRHILLR